MEVTEGQVLYKTKSLCAICTLLELKGLVWQDATVNLYQGKVYLTTLCATHGSQPLLYCSNEEFFRRVLSYSPSVFTPTLKDMEDYGRIDSSRQNFPLLVELSLWKADSGVILTDEEIKVEIKRVQAIFATKPEQKFILKLQGKLTNQIQTLNQKVLFIEKSFAESNLVPILIEVSHERLIALCNLPDSIFLRPLVFPALKYFLRPGDEEQCENEIKDLIASVKSFRGIQMVITISVFKPWPKIHKILEFLRSSSCIGIVKCIVFNFERPPSEIINSIQLKKEELLQKSSSISQTTNSSQKNSSQNLSPQQQKSNPELDSQKQKQKQFQKDIDLKNLVQIKHENQIILPGKSFEIIKQIPESYPFTSATISYEFKTLDYDISFGIVFESFSNFKEVSILPMSRYSSHLQTIQGNLPISQNGIYKFQFDNTYSKLRKKKLTYLISIFFDSKSTDSNSNQEESIDVYSLLEEIEAQSNKSITTKDFSPLAIGRIVEPFLHGIELGNFSIRPSPFCAFITILMNLNEIKSKPLSRYIDLDKLYLEMIPLLPQFEGGEKRVGEGGIWKNMMMLKKIKKIGKKNWRGSEENGEFPDLMSYVVGGETGGKKGEVMKEWFAGLQYLVVHNMMDIGGLDMVRRCNCGQVVIDSTSKYGIAASCTGCV